MIYTRNIYMEQALELAKLAYDEGEVPVGCVIVCNGEVIGTGRNRRETKQNALLHAEIEAINNACIALKSWRLSNCEMYVTLEPCPMCSGAIINSRIKKVVYGAKDFKSGSCESVINLFALPYNHKPDVLSGIMENDCSKILKDFFKKVRDEKKQ